MPIDDLADPRVAPYRNVRDADLAGRAHAFIVEARFNVQTLLGPGSRFAPESILGTPVALDAVADDLARVPEGVPVYEASQPVMDEIVGFHIHRGLLALARRAPVPTAEALLDAEGFPRVVVCVEDLTNHDNMGAIFRNAAAFGAGAVCITERCCDPLYRKAVRVSMGYVLRLPFATVPGGAEGVEAVRALGYANIALTPRDSAATLDDVSSWAAARGTGCRTR